MGQYITGLGRLADHPQRFAITEIIDCEKLLARFLAIERVATHGSGRRVCFYGGICRGVIVERTLRGDGHLVPTIAANRRRIILPGMASLIGLPIPRTPASVRRDYVRSTFRTLYAEWSSLIHFNHRLRSIPRIQHRLMFSRRIAGRVLRCARCVVAGTVTGSIHRTTVSFARANGLSYKLGRLSIDAAGLSARLGTLESLVGRVVQLFWILGSLRHGQWITGLVRRPTGWRRYGIVLRTNAHTAISSAGRRTTTGALRNTLLLRSLLRQL